MHFSNVQIVRNYFNHCIDKANITNENLFFPLAFTNVLTSDFIEIKGELPNLLTTKPTSQPVPVCALNLLEWMNQWMTCLCF